MTTNFITQNLTTILYVTWAIIAISTLLMLKKHNNKTIAAEKSIFSIFIILIILLVFIIMYTSNFGLEWFKALIANYPQTDIVLIALTIVILILSIKLTQLSIKLKQQSSQIQKIDQRYSIDKNHEEYQKRKNSPIIYRSE